MGRKFLAVLLSASAFLATCPQASADASDDQYMSLFGTFVGLNFTDPDTIAGFTPMGRAVCDELRGGKSAFVMQDQLIDYFSSRPAPRLSTNEVATAVMTAANSAYCPEVRIPYSDLQK